MVKFDFTTSRQNGNADRRRRCKIEKSLPVTRYNFKEFCKLQRVTGEHFSFLHFAMKSKAYGPLCFTDCFTGQAKNAILCHTLLHRPNFGTLSLTICAKPCMVFQPA